MKRLFIFSHVGLFTILGVLLCVGFGYRVHYLWADPHIRGILRSLQRLGRVQAIDFQLCDRLNPRFFHDETPIAYEGVDEWERMKPILHGLSDLFPGISDLDTKFHRWFADRLRDDNMEPGSPICGWVDGFVPAGCPVTIVSEHRHSFERYVELPHHKISVLTLWSPVALATLFLRTLIGRLGGLRTSVAEWLSGPDAANAAREEVADDDIEFDPERYRALYFPHKGVAYLDLYAKDQFYTEDRTSPLHPTTSATSSTTSKSPHGQARWAAIPIPIFWAPSGLAPNFGP
jgi:hypothetical protein